VVVAGSDSLGARLQVLRRMLLVRMLVVLFDGRQSRSARWTGRRLRPTAVSHRVYSKEFSELHNIPLSPLLPHNSSRPLFLLRSRPLKSSWRVWGALS